MPKGNVSDYLKLARQVAALADRKSGDEKKRLMEIAEAWLKLADEAAVNAKRSADIAGALPEHRKSH